MGIEADVKTLLDADNGAGGVYTLLTGKIYTYEETGMLGIDRQSTPNAYDTATPKLKPCAVVKQRDPIPDGGIRSDHAQKVSYRQVIEIWLYNDGAAGFATLRTVKARLFVVLHGKQIVGSTKLAGFWIGGPDGLRDPNLDNACVVRADYVVRGLT
jgi:hypothetical protein